MMWVGCSIGPVLLAVRIIKTNHLSMMVMGQHRQRRHKKAGEKQRKDSNIPDAFHPYII
jgi:hypothetical protein